jgi:hypothetical protein
VSNGHAVIAANTIGDGAKLLDDLGHFIRRFATLSQEQVVVCSLWTVHTHAIEAAHFTPYLRVYSPVMRSGKTRVLEVEKLLVNKPWFTGRVTASALVRKTHHDHPTLLLDESDTAFNAQKEYSEALRGILNSGFERDGTYSMCVTSEHDWKPQDFSTFSPKMIAGIGRLPSTIEDRSIPLQLKRARRGEHERFHRLKVKPEADELKGRIDAWVVANLGLLKQAQPQLPDELNDRQQDVCEPLLAIADVAGGEWPERARMSLVALCGFSELMDDSLAINLLSDIRGIFCAIEPVERISTQYLLQRLFSLEDARWRELDRGGTLTPHMLAKFLRPFEIAPKNIRLHQGTLKGYLRSDFVDAWGRYVPIQLGSKGQQGLQPSVYAAPDHFCEGQQESLVADRKDAK